MIRWSLRNRAAVIALALVLTAIGVYIARRMPVDVFPDLTAPTVTVITEAHGMAPVEVESQVTFPIETAVNGASGVRRVRSSTAVGISVVWVEFDWGMDIYAARQIVSEKVSLIAGDLPPEVERPILAPISSIMGEILFLALTSDRHSPIELRTTADTTLRRRLLSVPGVSQVTPIGGGEKQYQVILSPSKTAHLWRDPQTGHPSADRLEQKRLRRLPDRPAARNTWSPASAACARPRTSARRSWRRWTACPSACRTSGACASMRPPSGARDPSTRSPR